MFFAEQVSVLDRCPAEDGGIMSAGAGLSPMGSEMFIFLNYGVQSQAHCILAV